MDKTKNGGYKSAFLTLLIAVGVAIAAQYFFPVAFVLPIILAYAIVRCGYGLGGVIIGVSLLGTYIINPLLCLMLAAAFVLPSLTAGFVIKKQLRFFDSVLAVSAASLCGVAIAFGALWLISGTSPIDYLTALYARSLQMLSDSNVNTLYQLVRYADVTSGAIIQSAVNTASSAEAIDAMQEIFRNSLNIGIVSHMIIYALLSGLLCVVIPRRRAKKNGLPVADAPAFDSYKLPKRFWLAFVLSYLAMLIGTETGWYGFYIAEFTVSNVYTFVFTVQGLCFLDYLYKKREMGAVSRVALHVLTSLMAGFIIMLIGMIENMGDLRKRIEQKGGALL